MFLVDLIAQLVEHLPFKERVLGSSPSQITNIQIFFSIISYTFNEEERNDNNIANFCGGSIGLYQHQSC